MTSSTIAAAAAAAAATGSPCSGGVGGPGGEGEAAALSQNYRSLHLQSSGCVRGVQKRGAPPGSRGLKEEEAEEERR